MSKKNEVTEEVTDNIVDESDVIMDCPFGTVRVEDEYFVAVGGKVSIPFYLVEQAKKILGR